MYILEGKLNNPLNGKNKTNFPPFRINGNSRIKKWPFYIYSTFSSHCIINILFLLYINILFSIIPILYRWQSHSNGISSTAICAEFKLHSAMMLLLLYGFSLFFSLILFWIVHKTISQNQFMYILQIWPGGIFTRL